jgi:hypothetical protein
MRYGIGLLFSTAWLSASAAIAQEQAADAAPTKLLLVCQGQGSTPGAVGSVGGYQYNSESGGFENNSKTVWGQQKFGTDVQVEIVDGKGRIRLPDQLVPLISPGSDNGWFELRDLKMEPGRITARYRMNLFNSPKVVIDRQTGSLSIDGIEKFYGQCTKAADKPLF